MLRATIWLSVLAWAASEVLRRADAMIVSSRRGAARALYSAGAVLLVAHTIAAFQLYHGWSHDAAWAATALRSEAVTGFASGAGLYLNYLFVALWTADAAWWWVRPRAYARRSRAIEIAIFAFFVFMFVNGAVVFAAGPMRIAGAAAVAAALVARAGLPRPRLQGDRT